LADLITVPFTGEAALVADAIVAHAGPVRHSMIGGQWAIKP
jgi:hypothetical protein